MSIQPDIESFIKSHSLSNIQAKLSPKLRKKCQICRGETPYLTPIQTYSANLDGISASMAICRFCGPSKLLNATQRPSPERVSAEVQKSLLVVTEELLCYVECYRDDVIQLLSFSVDNIYCFHHSLFPVKLKGSGKFHVLLLN